jgi:hypothetical protein
VHPTDLLNGQAIGNCSDGFLPAKAHFTLFEPILPGGVYEKETDRRSFGDEHPGRRIPASAHFYPGALTGVSKRLCSSERRKRFKLRGALQQ